MLVGFVNINVALTREQVHVANHDICKNVRQPRSHRDGQRDSVGSCWHWWKTGRPPVPIHTRRTLCSAQLHRDRCGASRRSKSPTTDGLLTLQNHVVLEHSREYNALQKASVIQLKGYTQKRFGTTVTVASVASNCAAPSSANTSGRVAGAG